MAAQALTSQGRKLGAAVRRSVNAVVWTGLCCGKPKAVVVEEDVSRVDPEERWKPVLLQSQTNVPGDGTEALG